MGFDFEVFCYFFWVISAVLSLSVDRVNFFEKRKTFKKKNDEAKRNTRRHKIHLVWFCLLFCWCCCCC